jgi:GNAT superfamily N-acetyltransferase
VHAAGVTASITIRPLREDELAWAAERYREIAFQTTPPGSVALVAELAGERVGLGRLVPLEPGRVELGGIWTAGAARGRGVARAMVRELFDRAVGVDVWCVPFDHLTELYLSFGLQRAKPPWPNAITTKVEDCERRALPAVTVLRAPPERGSTPWTR